MKEVFGSPVVVKISWTIRVVGLMYEVCVEAVSVTVWHLQWSAGWRVVEEEAAKSLFTRPVPPVALEVLEMTVLGITFEAIARSLENVGTSMLSTAPSPA
jgi:hypothetical protein